MQTPVSTRKILWTIILVIFLALSIVPQPRHIIFEGHIFLTVDNAAADYVDDSLKRAASAFAIARTFNAIVSVFRESAIQAEPGGIGATIAAGAALDPINDLVERFSWVMLASMTSLGIQAFLIKIVPFISVQILLPLALLSLLAGLWISKIISFNFTKIGKILLFSFILLRFSVPAMAYLNNLAYVGFLENKEKESIEVIGQTTEKLEDQQTDTPAAEMTKSKENEEDQGWLTKTKKSLGAAVDLGKEALDIKGKIEFVKNVSTELIDHIVNLIVIFVVNTIFLPILFLWGLFRIGRLFISRGFGMAFEEWFLRKVGETDK